MTQGQRIHQMRKSRRYTLEYIADMLGTTKQCIYKYENDIVKTIPTEKMQKLALLLGCTPQWLMDGTGDNSPEAVSPEPPRDASDDNLHLYRDIVSIMLHMNHPELESLKDFAQFIVARRTEEKQPQ